MSINSNHVFVSCRSLVVTGIGSFKLPAPKHDLCVLNGMLDAEIFEVEVAVYPGPGEVSYMDKGWIRERNIDLYCVDTPYSFSVPAI